MAQTYQARADELKGIRDAQIPQEYRIPTDNLPLNVSQTYRTCGLLSEHQLGILDLDATALARAIASRKYTSLEVIEAFIVSASVAQQTINCLASLDAEQARSRARWLDEQLEKTGKTVGPLHGVPISVKDFVWIKDWPQTAGNVNSYKVPTDDAHLVAILRAAGAVFYAKGTQPQSIMHLETYNFYGKTLNPYNRNLTPGGSSGGDAALVAARGSILGVTTDVGGSTRGPAGDCGLWGYKPTSKRIPRYGVQPVSTSSRIAGAVGPVAHTFRDIELFTRIIFGAEGWRDDVILMPLPWREVAADGSGLGFQPWQGDGGKLRVGVVYDDGVVRPLKPMRRALDDMAAKLVNAGHEVVAFEGFAQTDGKAKVDVARAWKLTAALYWTDGGDSLRQALGDEPLLPMTEWILSQGSGPLTRDEITVLIAERNAMRQAMLDAMKAQRLDILLCPPSPGPARPHETSKYWSYTSFYNLMDWPGLVFPTGRQVSEQEDDEDPDYAPRNDTEKHVYDSYSAEYSVDAPIGLQLVAPRWQDERLFAAAKIIEQSLPL